MNEIILELSKKYFVQLLSNGRLAVLANHRQHLFDISYTYDSLTLMDWLPFGDNIKGTFTYE